MLTALSIFSPISGHITTSDQEKIIISSDRPKNSLILHSPIEGKVLYIEIIKGKWLGKNKKYKNTYIDIWIKPLSPAKTPISIALELENNENVFFYIEKGQILQEKQKIVKLTEISDQFDIIFKFRNHISIMFKPDKLFCETYVGELIGTLIV
jgi:hypothetical protein